MNNSIFRKVALDRLSSPEELDQLITVTKPRGWIALAGFICILLSGIIWGFVGSIPIEVNGIGMITANAGAANVIHSVQGRITDVRVKPGDYVKKGDVIARTEQRELVDEINTIRKNIELSKDFNADAYDKNSKDLSASLNDLYDIAIKIKQANEAINIEKDMSNYKLAELNLQQYQLDAAAEEKNFEKQKALYEAGAIPQKEYDDAASKLDMAKKQVEIAAEELRKAQLNALTPDEQANLRYLREQLETKKTVIVSELTKKLDKAEDDLIAYSSIVSQVEGRILEVNAEKGAIIQAGVPVARIIRDDRTVNSLEVVLYVSPEEGKKIIAGMDAHISPTIIKKEDYGYMLGKVVAVSEYPTSVQSLVQTLGNEELANKFSGGSAPIEVRVNFIPDSSTFSGFKWSTSKGPDIKIDSGNICTGSIVIQSRRPAEMVIPYFKKKLNLK